MGSVTRKRSKLPPQNLTFMRCQWPSLRFGFFSLISLSVQIHFFFWQLYSGNIPFPEKSDPNVVIVVLKGQRPPKPPSAQPLGLTPAVWRLTRRCWLKNAAKRPDADEVLARLEGMWDSSGDSGADDVDDDVSLDGVNQKMSPEESKAKLLFAKAEYKAQKAMDHAERQAKRVKKQRPKTTDGYANFLLLVFG